MGPLGPALAELASNEKGPVLTVHPDVRIERIVRDCHAFVWRTLRRFGLTPDEADDAAQRVFVVASRRLTSIDDGAERAFLFGTAVRVAAGVRRLRRNTVELGPDAVVATLESPEELLDQHRARQLLDALLDTLPARLRSVLVLSELEQLSKTEVGHVLGIAPGTVASRLRRARRLLEQRAARVIAAAGWRGGAK